MTRRDVLRIGVLAGAAAAVACTRSVAGNSAAAGPMLRSDAPAPAPQEISRASEWEQLVASAREEGQLSLVTLVNRGWATVIESFERAFPGVAVRRLAESSASVWSEAVRRGQAAGSQSFDLAFVQPGTTIRAEAPAGPWAPIRPLLFRPDVLDGAAWRGGLDARFLDAGSTLSFDWEHHVHHAYLVKTDLVGEGEIKSVRDLLDPKWRGSVLSSDPRMGDGLTAATAVAKAHGDDVLRQLLVDQRPTYIGADGWGKSQAAEFVRGPFPIARNLRPKPLADVRAAGLANNLKYLDLPDADFVPSVAMMYVDGAPHPAAAKLFANWILTREGQTLLTGSLPTNSARTDVPPFDPDAVGAPGNTYYDPDATTNEAHAARTAAFVRGLLARG
jgi:iron(III) transport system substrate-binding protein